MGSFTEKLRDATAAIRNFDPAWEAAGTRPASGVATISGFDFAADRRVDRRLAFQPMSTPLVGWRSGMRALFQFRPVDISRRGMRLALTLDRSEDALLAGEALDLCLPFLYNEEFLNQASVRWTRSEAALCGVCAQSPAALSVSYHV